MRSGQSPRGLPASLIRASASQLHINSQRNHFARSTPTYDDNTKIMDAKGSHVDGLYQFLISTRVSASPCPQILHDATTAVTSFSARPHSVWNPLGPVTPSWQAGRHTGEHARGTPSPLFSAKNTPAPQRKRKLGAVLCEPRVTSPSPPCLLALLLPRLPLFRPAKTAAIAARLLIARPVEARPSRAGLEG